MNLYISKLISRRNISPNMIVPSFRLYHFAVKLIWKRMLALTLLFWLGVAGSILCGKRDACLAGIWLVAAIDGG